MEGKNNNDETMYSKHFERIFNGAKDFATTHNNTLIHNCDLLIGLIQNPDCFAYKILLKNNVDFKNIFDSYLKYRKEYILEDQECEYPGFDMDSRDVIFNAISEASSFGIKKIDSVHILLGLLSDNLSFTNQQLSTYKITYRKIKEEINVFFRSKIEHYLPPKNGIFTQYFYKFFSQNAIKIFENIIENEEIRYSQCEALNDRFDMQIIIDKLFDFKNLLFNKSHLNLENKNYLSYETLNSFSSSPYSSPSSGIDYIRDIMQNLPIYLDKFENLIKSNCFSFVEKEFLKHFGVLCLTDSINSNPMWSHYASNYKGFALQIDARNKYFNSMPETAPISPIKYSITPPRIDNLLTSLKYDEKLIIEYLFKNKSIEWEYENEWRIVSKLRDAKTLDDKDCNDCSIHLLPFPRELVTGIIFGLDFNAIEKKRIIDKIQSDEKFSHIIPFDSKINKEKRIIEIVEIILPNSINL